LAAEKLDVTVCVCTRNRAAELITLLNSFVRMDVPAGLVWEVLVVDNGSSDNTRETALAFADRLPIRYVVEPQAGVANARNRVFDEARGVYTCWVDDDVEVAPDWLAAYLEAFRRHPEASLFGGVVEPLLEPPTPAWFARLAPLWPLADVVARRDLGPIEIPLSFEGDRMPYGANMAIRSAAQKAVRFDNNLGPSPNFRRSGEETEMLFDLMKTGVTGWWVPGARVRHHIVSKRQSRKYVFNYYYAIGETMAYLDGAKSVHYMNQDGKTRSLVGASASVLYLTAAIQWLLFVGFTAIGLTRRGLYHLRRQAIARGAASFKAQAAA
jgi:glycosyltransferase involved in cell wall biosynthesis